MHGLLLPLLVKCWPQTETETVLLTRVVKLVWFLWCWWTEETEWRNEWVVFRCFILRWNTSSETLSNRGELNHLRDCNLIWFWAGVVREEEDWSSDSGIEQSPSDWRVEYCYYCVLISGGDKFQSSGGPPSLSIRWCVRRENIPLNSKISFFTSRTFNWN